MATAEQIKSLIRSHLSSDPDRFITVALQMAAHEAGLYLFDEFDAIGGERSLDNDVGEMRRVLSSFLQFIEQDISDSVIVAVTNSPKLLDRALFRRFDDMLYYEQPTTEECKSLIQNVLGTFMPSKLTWKTVLKESDGLSHAEIDQ